MKKAISLLLILTLCAVLCAPAGAASVLTTSANPDNTLTFSLQGSRLTVSGTLTLSGLTGVTVRCGGASGQVSAQSGRSFTVTLPLSHQGTAAVNVYTARNGSGYVSMVRNRIHVEKTEEGYRFPASPTLTQNLAFQNSCLDPADYLDETAVSAQIRTFVRLLTEKESGDYAKLFRVYRWVVDNLYYDMDSVGGTPVVDASGVLRTRRTVVAGYVEFLRSMVMALGIPCVKVFSYALGAGDAIPSYALGAQAGEKANHVHLEAWLDGRWVAMDPGWDSNNQYVNGQNVPQPATGYYYFDLSQELLALDRLVLRRGDLTAPTVPAFKDVPLSAHYAEAVTWAQETGLTAGVSKDTFGAKRTVTRAQAVTFLWRLAGEPTATNRENPFTDVPGDAYYREAVLWAVERGITRGTKETAFSPNTPLRTDQLLTFLARSAGQPLDGDNWATEAMTWAQDKGLFTGLDPIPEAQTRCTRADTVYYLWKSAQ